MPACLSEIVRQAAYLSALHARARACSEASSAALDLPIATPATVLASSANALARDAASAAPSADFFASPASLVRFAISPSAIVWRCLEKRKIPPSANNSPATPIITNISKTLTCFFQRSTLAYSPTSPTTSNTPNSSSAISDKSIAVDVADFENAKRMPIVFVRPSSSFRLRAPRPWASLVRKRIKTRTSSPISGAQNFPLTISKLLPGC